MVLQASDGHWNRRIMRIYEEAKKRESWVCGEVRMALQNVNRR